MSLEKSQEALMEALEPHKRGPKLKRNPQDRGTKRESREDRKLLEEKR